MAIGPIELLVVKFPGNQFKGEIAPALRELVDSGTIQIIDLIFAIKDEEGTLASSSSTPSATRPSRSSSRRRLS